ncbi:hypothetical protein BT67DRAFT_377789 [Trichocladium antarcticum]|uniref:F-box domain-containing protein n=1 Tax=Trichocladium antarcticum TaxID=1450529 RepID=A0AAN6ZEZ5_9PEZI|nr:hypothetical protein BT67DRAFT_377789 [Trichocladium antarcticum]
MDRLPQETFDAIVQICDVGSLPAPLSRYATISRQWQYAVERRLFSRLDVDADNMPMLEYVLSSNRRRGYVDELWYKVLANRLPSQSTAYTGLSLSHACNLKMSSELRQLWNLLSLYWTAALTRGKQSQPPSDAVPRLKLVLGLFLDPNHELKPSNSLPPHGPEGPPFPWTPPALPGIASLRMIWRPSSRVYHARNCHPPWLFALLPTCTSATRLCWDGVEPYPPAQIVGTSFRNQMVASLVSAGRFANLQHLGLHFQTPVTKPQQRDHLEACEPVAAVRDPLNQTLHTLSQQLRSLYLSGKFLLSPDLFWPDVATAGDKSCVEPSWPLMEEMIVEARLVSPDGRFYCDPAFIHQALSPRPVPIPPGTGPSLFGDLVVRATRAMARMPRLKRLSTTFPELMESAHFGAVMCRRMAFLYSGTRPRESPPWYWHGPSIDIPGAAHDNWNRFCDGFPGE